LLQVLCSHALGATAEFVRFCHAER
jgi:hypothetical protein